MENAWGMHEDIVRWMIWKIIRTYGGDYEELLSEAFVLFAKAVKTHNPNLSSVSTWIGYTVYHGLLEIKRTEARRLNITGPVSSLSDLRDIVNPKDSLSDLWKILSPDSQCVLNVLFGMRGLERFKNKSLAKLSLRKELLSNNWSSEKVNRCFREIEAAVLT
jgi:hypothetical protein